MSYLYKLYKWVMFGTTRSTLSIEGNVLRWRNAMHHIHRDYDKPAVIWPDGTMGWYQHNRLHRDNDLPALVDVCNSIKEWHQRGELHRDNDLPAVISGLHTEWWQHGQLHREQDMPAVIFADGYREWYQHGKFIREDLT